MRTKVALIAHRRPEYLLQTVDALKACAGYESLDEIVLMHDDASKTGAPCTELIESFKVDDYFAPVPMRAVHQIKKCGIVGNTVLGMKACFDTGADVVFMLEDDGVLSPDALQLLNWYLRAGDDGLLPHHRDNYVSFSLSAHGEQRTRKEPPGPGELVELNFLGCPFAYAVRAEKWPFIRENWCCKKYHPCGWSWSMTYAARHCGFRSISPMLSRCRNIGRELGVNESPGSWDELQGPSTGLTYSSEPYDGPFHFTKIVDDEEARDVSSWMLPEIAKAPGARFDAWVGSKRPPELDWEHYDGREQSEDF